MIRIQISSEICTPCGECCRNFPYIPIDKDDINRLKEETNLYRHEFTNVKDAKADEYFLKFNDAGDCIFLKQENNLFSCSVYNARPKICANYPVTDKQFDFCEKKINNL